MEQRLSEFLLEQVDLYGTDGAGLPSKHDRTMSFYLEKIAKQLIESRESFTDGDFHLLDLGSDLDRLDLEKGVLNDSGIFEMELDGVLSRQILENMSVMVTRLILLSKLEGLQTPSSQTAVYIREAAQTYVYGFMQASAAMSRAAVEQALKEKLGLQSSGDRVGFQKLVNAAEKKKILDSSAAEQARNYFAPEANAVLHHGPADDKTTLRILDVARGLLRHIYSV